MNEGVRLITYADSMSQDIQGLHQNLNQYFSKAIAGVHLLPFFPSSGDRGFAPLRYDQVDPQFGSWQDVQNLAKDYDLMADFMVNHLSPASPEFKDWQAKGDASVFAGLFLDWDQFWPKNRPTQADIDLIYKRKNRAPVSTVPMQDGSVRHVWNTFGDQQMDLDVQSPAAQAFFEKNLNALIARGVKMIRLDAFAYAVKQQGTNDFFVEPGIWKLLSRLEDIVKPAGVTLLPEIHEHYTIVHKLAAHGYYIYDFALPIILLHSLYTGDSLRLAHWLKISPMHQFTTLDTHDGIGVVDGKDLLTDDELGATQKALYAKGANVKPKYSSAAYHNLDVYQINTTYYSALGDDDAAYLLARAVQVFAPGIPMVYYVGLLAGKNDLALLEKTKEGRNINRHYYTQAEIAQNVQRPVVQQLLNLLALRNTCAAFALDGKITVTTPTAHEIRICRQNAAGTSTAVLAADLKAHRFTITVNGENVAL